MLSLLNANKTLKITLPESKIQDLVTKDHVFHKTGCLVFRVDSFLTCQEISVANTSSCLFNL